MRRLSRNIFVENIWAILYPSCRLKLAMSDCFRCCVIDKIQRRQFEDIYNVLETFVLIILYWKSWVISWTDHFNISSIPLLTFRQKKQVALQCLNFFILCKFIVLKYLEKTLTLSFMKFWSIFFYLDTVFNT